MGNTKVVVKEAAQQPQPEEQLTMTAAVKGVKTIEVNFNKAIASPDAVKVTVKKGNAARDCKATVDGSKITVAMDAKLTAGTYTVSVEGVDTAAMTADVVVEKDETLTSFEISDYLVAQSTTVTTTGTIKYAALNQYGEKMTSTEPTATCSFSANTKVTTAATATKEGEITVTGMADMLAIVGTKGTVVLVGDKGVTTTKEISYNVAATASTVELIGTYHTNSAALKDIKEDDTISDYELLFTVKDQYGYDIEANKLGDTFSVSLVGGLTRLSTDGTLSTRTYKDVDYVALKLQGASNGAGGTYKAALAGDANLMIVNKYKGLLLNTTLTVGKNVVIKSISVSADNGVYEDQDNELSYEIVDADGKSVTSYVDLKNSVTLTAGIMRFERKADGSAKLIYNPGANYVTRADVNSDKNSTPQVVTISANSAYSSDFMLKTFTFTVNQKRVVKGVTGVKSDVATSTAKGGRDLEIKLTDLILADQYSNKVTSDEGIFSKTMEDGKTTTGAAIAVYVDDKGVVDYTLSNNKLTVSPKAVGTATVYLKYVAKAGGEATTSDYDAKFNISVYDTAGVDVSTLVIDSINDGYAVQLGANGKTATGAALDVSKIKVVATVGGSKTVIPSSQLAIIKNENNELNKAEINAGTDTKTAKLTVQVTTWDSTNTPIETLITKEYQVSSAAAKIYKVTDATDKSEAFAKKTLSGADFIAQCKFKDQYGADITNGSASDATYKIECTSASSNDGYSIAHNNSSKATLELKTPGYYKFKITVTTSDGSSKSYTYSI